jgi:hypothetical protein
MTITTSPAPSADQAEQGATPRLPSGRSIHLPGRGTTFIREMPAR